MGALQAIILGMLLALTPSAWFLTWVLWQGGKLSSRRPDFFEDRLAVDLKYFTDHINDAVSTPEQLVARLRLLVEWLDQLSPIAKFLVMGGGAFLVAMVVGWYAGNAILNFGKRREGQ